MAQTFEEWWQSTNFSAHSNRDVIASCAYHAGHRSRDAEVADLVQSRADFSTLYLTERKRNADLQARIDSMKAEIPRIVHKPRIVDAMTGRMAETSFADEVSDELLRALEGSK